MNKVNYFQSVFLMFTLSSCFNAIQTEKQITGNWKNKTDYLSINDSVIITSRFREFKKFNRSGDTLITDQYKIYGSKMSDDSLVFTLIKNNLQPEYFRMKSLMTFESEPLDRIVFSSMGCYGECPIFNLELNNSGECFFQGIEFTDSIGDYTSQDNRHIFTLLGDKIKTVDLRSLDTLYSFRGADAPFVSLNIFVEGKLYSMSVYGNRVEPRELRMVIDCILDIYKDIKWVKTNKHHLYTSSKPLPIEPVVKIPNEP